MARLFIAINLPADIKQSLAGLQKQLDISRQYIKWVEKDNFHLTLKFLGEVVEQEIMDLEDAICKAASQHSKFDLALRSLGAFPNLRRPRVLWVGVDGESSRPWGFLPQPGAFLPI